MFSKLFSVLSRVVLGVIGFIIIVGVPFGVFLACRVLLATFNVNVSTIVFSFLGPFLGLYAAYFLGDVTVAWFREFRRKRRSAKAFRKGMTSNDR